jgi:hypothetical protein
MVISSAPGNHLKKIDNSKTNRTGHGLGGCHGERKTMKTLQIRAALLTFLLFVSTLGFSQSSNGTIGGSVADASGAVIPGVTVTATNNATGVVTTVLSNDAGVYNLASLLPGIYKVTATLAGFQTQTFNDVTVGNATQLRLNFTLQVAAAAQAVEVSVEAENLITASSSSIGGVLAQKVVQDLPLVSNNVLDLVATMGGTYMTNDKIFGAEQTNFAGVSARDVNISRDGISVNNERWPNGLETPTKMNPDLVGEIRMILAPVDAEMGRGNGQVQILTRSGTNQFRGSATWNIQNTALDANTWSNNSRRVTPAWRNAHDYSIAFGGPIKKNKTFFYTVWNQLMVESRQEVFPNVLTECARRGIFRYYDGYINGNARQLQTVVGGFPQIATVNADGSPKAPLDANGQPLPLRYLSVFGQLAANPTKADCSDAQISTSTLVPTGATSSWDTYRKQLDQTGFISAVMASMPHANAFDNPNNVTGGGGDGLNTAVYRWVRRNKGADNLFGAGGDINNNRRQINGKIDHNFNERHKINGSYSFEIDKSDDAALPTWPTGYFGADRRQPQTLSVNFTSTLSNSMVNEARWGFIRTGANTVGAPERDDIGATVRKGMLQVGGGPIYTSSTTGALGFATYGVADGILYGSHEVSPRWVYSDSLSWTHGVHSFKFGGEYRLSSTKSTNQGSVQTGANRPTATMGNATLAQVTNIGRTGLAGNAGVGSQQLAENLLTFLSGSLSGLRQGRFINQAKPSWNDYPNELAKVRDIAQNEFSFFFKDDWKATRDLTLNLGTRWDYYGVPWERNGLTTGLKGGGNALFGISGRSFSDWMKPFPRADLMEIIYVGPNSPNPSQAIYNRDLNNFGPAVGFAWNIPWAGKDKTTLRGGYQVQFIGGGRGFVLDTAIGNPPGSSNTANYVIPPSDPYLSIEKLVANPGLVPVQPLFLPNPTSTIIPVTDRTGLLNAFDPNFVSPYIQNLTLSLTRTLNSKVTLDLRYIGTLSRKLPSNIDLNAPNFLFNGMKDALDAARRGDESPLLDQMLKGLNLGGTNGNCLTATSGVTTPCAAVGTVNSQGVLQTGAMHLRSLNASCGTGCTFNTALANGNYVGVVTGLNTLNNTVSGARAGSVLVYNGFPENFIRTNPQFQNAVMETSLGHANYHSLQTQINLRPVAGVTTQVTYTWSRNLGMAPGEGPNGLGATFTDPTNRAPDYALLSTHRKHVVVDYGTFALPVGPGKLLFGKSSGFAARLMENWQASWIVNMSSGAPISVTAQSMLYGNGVPDVVGPFDNNAYKAAWNNGAATGNIFTDSNGQPLYTRVKDPQCTNAGIVAPSLQGLCTLNAIRNASGQIILQTPLPGTRGTLGRNTLEGLGTWTADMAMEKRVRVAETKSVTLRVDARNVFNHPTPAIPFGFSTLAGGADVGLQSTNPFGTFTTKTGNRSFQAKLRVDF